LSYSPIIQVQFVHEPMPRGVNFDRLDVTPIQTPTVKTKYDVGMFVRVEGDKMYGRLEYNRSLFAADTAARFVEHFVRALERGLDDPAVKIGVIALEDDVSTCVDSSDEDATPALVSIP